jgi:Tol biopolymer transport system component
MRCPRIPPCPAALAAGLLASAALAAPAGADVFDGRIGFTSFRADPQASPQVGGDIFSMNPDGSDVRRLTTSPQLDRQPDWSPGGTQIAYSIRKPGERVNFEVARMTADGRRHKRLTTTVAGQASSQPSWFPNGRGLLFRRSGPGLVASIWQLNRLGENPLLRFSPPHPPLYPSFSPDMSKIAFAGILSPAGDTDRGVFVVNADGSGLRTLFDVAGSYDSAPAWSPDGTRIAFESNADVGGANPERDMEIWTMAADGSSPKQLTRNAAHDEGAAWSPDGGRMLAYTSGPDNEHGDIHVMTAAGRHLRRLTTFAGPDESPDWQSIPAPKTDRRCGDAVRSGPGARDVRAAGHGATCAIALDVARRWSRGRPRTIGGFAVTTTGFGGTRRVVMTRAGKEGRQLVAFLLQPAARLPS